MLTAKYDKNILQGLKDIKQEFAKSCAGGDISYLTNPNLRQETQVYGQIINMVRDTSRLLSDITTVDRADCSGKIPRLDICDVVASGACVTCDVGMEFDDSYIPYDMKKYKVRIMIPVDFFDCNDLGSPQEVEEIIQAMLFTQLRNNMEMAAIYGDESLTVGTGQSKLTNLLGINDGFLKIAADMVPDAQVIDAQGKGLSPELFMSMKAKVPVRYQDDVDNFRVLGGPGMERWYQLYLSQRPTDAGDQALRFGEMARIWNNQFYKVPTWKEDFVYGTAPNEQSVTHLLFTKLDNLALFNRRKLQLMKDYLPDCDKNRYVGYWEQDHQIIKPEEMVLVKNVDVCNYADPYNGCCYGTQLCNLGTTPDPLAE